MEYKTALTGEYTAPLTCDSLMATFQGMFKKPAPRVERWPKQFCDTKKLAEIGFMVGWDEYAEMYMTSSAEMKRAKDAGAIWYEDEKGNRV